VPDESVEASTCMLPLPAPEIFSSFKDLPDLSVIMILADVNFSGNV